MKVVEVENIDGSKSLTVKGNWEDGLLEQYEVPSELHCVGFTVDSFNVFENIAPYIEKLGIIGVKAKSDGLNKFINIK